jgi:class 3 adenylate cyclase
VKDTLANLDSARLRSFAALHIAASAGVERLSAKDIADCLEAAEVALHESEVRDALEKAVLEGCVTVKRDESRALVYKLMTKGKKDIEPLLGSDGMSIVLIDGDQPRTDRRRLGDTETMRHPRIVLAFDLCSSSKIMEDLLLNDKFRDYKAFLTCIKRWLIDQAKKQPPTNDCFELYKFTGDGWILLFPTTTSGGALLEFMRGLCEMVSAELARHIIPNLSSKPAVLGATIGVETGSLVKMTMNDRDEYVGRALNIACRLQNAVKENEPSPEYKALVSAPLYNASLSQLTVPYKVEPVTLPLRNILSGSGSDCWRIDFTVDDTGHELPWPEQQTSGWTCARSNWKDSP